MRGTLRTLVIAVGAREQVKHPDSPMVAPLESHMAQERCRTAASANAGNIPIPERLPPLLDRTFFYYTSNFEQPNPIDPPPY